MSQYSKSFEREENRLMNKGVCHSVLSAVLFWAPIVSLILAISGFIRVAARVTRAHRVKKFFMLVLTLIIFIAILGSHIYAMYVYVRNPNILNELALKGWTAMTGETTLPWQTQTYAYDDYDDLDWENYEYDEDYEYDYDSDFDDRELMGFEEDLSEEEELDFVNSADSDDYGLSSTDSLDLYNQMKSERGIGSLGAVG
ncbi:MAG: hypothetical protein Q4D04_00590 [Clostridia bacterium]|nr:hypothetical protein [Clostridia bacterium]